MKISLLSIKNLIIAAAKVWKRFPLPLVSLLLICILAIYLVEYDNSINSNHEKMLRNIIFVLGLSSLIFASLKIHFETYNRKLITQISLYIISIAGLGLFYYQLPLKLLESDGIQIFVLYIGFVLVFIYTGYKNPALFPKERDPEEKYSIDFGNYELLLLNAFLTAVVYSFILYIGLVSAIFSINTLFELKLDEKIYFELWIIISSIIAPLIFLDKIPNLSEEEYYFEYPKPLKILVQYILLPLVTLYLLILYAYFIKIIAQQNFPKGIVSYLVLIYSMAGILSLFLTSPIEKLAENKWIKIYSRYFYRALIPLIVMLFIAIFKRINMYGVTEKRYFIVILAIWLSFITLYNIISRKKSIRMIPITLSIVAFIAVISPWNAFTISKYSQINRLKTLLIKNNLLKDNKIQKSEKDISYEDRKNISSIIKYFKNTHGLNELVMFPEETIAKNDMKLMTKELGFEFVLSHRNKNRFSVYSKIDNGIKIDGYDYLFYMSNRYTKKSKSIFIDNYNICWDRDIKSIIIKQDKEIMISLDMIKIVDKLIKDKIIIIGQKNKNIIYTESNDKIEVKLIFTRLYGTLNEDKTVKNLNSFYCTTLIKIKF